LIRGKVVRLPGGIVVRWPDELDDVERARAKRERQLDILVAARRAALLVPWNGRRDRGSS